MAEAKKRQLGDLIPLDGSQPKEVTELIERSDPLAHCYDWSMRRLGTVLLIAVLAPIGLLAWLLLAPGSNAEPQPFLVNRGEHLVTVAQRLESQGLIKSPLGFKLLARLRRLDRNLRPGRRELPAYASTWNVLEALRKKPVPARVAVPEGRTCWDIAEILDKAKLTDSLTFANLCEDAVLAKKLHLPTSRLEGYLFPDTYLFDGSESPSEIAATMTRHFREVWNGMDTASSPSFRELGPIGVLTLASIVEREAAARSESPLIAGVFYKRLQIGMTLGADPTVRYALRKFTGGLTVTDLAVESPYNTRKFQGLPPGPISNPGKDALRAALHPDTNKGYLYFVAKDDGSRQHDFASDYNVFLRSKHEAAKKRAVSGQQAP